jgi:hypothetical protein
MPILIRISGGDWGGAQLSDVGAVADAAAACFAGAIDSNESIGVSLEPTADADDVPIVLSTRNQYGELVVRVNIRGNLWARLAFQFAHEFCHVLANPLTWSVDRFSWLEESLCETASLFALRHMAKTWMAGPPYPNWRDYSSSLAIYAMERMSDPACSLPAQVQFNDWLSEHLALFEANPCRREDNTVVAKELLPIFEADNDAWRCIRYLHAATRSNSGTIRDFVSSWRDACPREVQSSVELIAAAAGGI